MFLTLIWPLNSFLNHTDQSLLSIIASLRAGVLQNIFRKQGLCSLTSLMVQTVSDLSSGQVLSVQDLRPSLPAVRISSWTQRSPTCPQVPSRASIFYWAASLTLSERPLSSCANRGLWRMFSPWLQSPFLQVTFSFFHWLKFHVPGSSAMLLCLLVPIKVLLALLKICSLVLSMSF